MLAAMIFSGSRFSKGPRPSTAENLRAGINSIHSGASSAAIAMAQVETKLPSRLPTSAKQPARDKTDRRLPLERSGLSVGSSISPSCLPANCFGALRISPHAVLALASDSTKDRPKRASALYASVSLSFARWQPLPESSIEPPGHLVSGVAAIDGCR